MTRTTVLAALAVVVGLAAATFAQADSLPAASAIDGVWRNPKNSVHVEIRPCGAGACGAVVWASAKAKADAREGGTENLIGMQLFRDFVRRDDGTWKGKVFVPDLNATFSGRAEVLDAASLKAKGCLIGGFLCKSQIWKRVGG